MLTDEGRLSVSDAFPDGIHLKPHLGRTQYCYGLPMTLLLHAEDRRKLVKYIWRVTLIESHAHEANFDFDDPKRAYRILYNC